MTVIIDLVAAMSAFAGLADLCVKLCISLNEMREQFVDAVDSFTAIKEDVNALSSIMRQMSNALEQSLAKGREWSLHTQINIRNIIGNCSASLLNLQKLLSKFENFSDLEGKGKAVKIRVIGMKLRWVWEEKRFVKIQQSLATQKGTLTTQLVAIQVVHGDQLMDILEQVLQRVSMDTEAAVRDIPAPSEEEVVAAIPALGLLQNFPASMAALVEGEEAEVEAEAEAEERAMQAAISFTAENPAGSEPAREVPTPPGLEASSNQVEDVQQPATIVSSQTTSPDVGSDTLDAQAAVEQKLPLSRASKAKSSAQDEQILPSNQESSRSLNPGAKKKKKVPLVITVDALFSAITANNKKMVLQVLQSGVEITAGAPDGTTPLQLAVILNREEIVLTFLFFGANPNAGGGHEGSPLLAAIGHGHSRLVKILLEAGADPSALGVLWKAATHSVEMVKLCIAEYPGVENKYPIDINAFNTNGDRAVNGETPLSVACNLGKVDMAHFLLEEAGADAAVVFKGRCVPQFRSALHASIVRKDENLVSLILAHLPDPNVCNDIRYEPGLLHCAIQTGKLPILRLLVDAGVDIDLSFPLYGTALQNACSANSLEMVQFLLQNHANPNIAPPNMQYISGFRCPLHVAICNGSIPMVEELLVAGADPNLHKGTLWLAAGKGSLPMVKRLLEIETLDLNDLASHASNYGETRGTALHNAAMQGNADMLRLLLEEGADPNVRTKFLGTPLDVAIKNSHQNCVDILIGGGDSDGPDEDVI